MLSSIEWSSLMVLRSELEDLKIKNIHPSKETKIVINWLENKVTELEKRKP